MTAETEDKKLMIKCYSCEELSYGCDQQANCPKENVNQDE